MIRRHFARCFHCQAALVRHRDSGSWRSDHDGKWYEGCCNEACARASLGTHAKVVNDYSDREAKVLALVAEYGDDVGFDFIAEKAGCTSEQAYTIFLHQTLKEVSGNE